MFWWKSTGSTVFSNHWLPGWTKNNSAVLCQDITSLCFWDAKPALNLGNLLMCWSTSSVSSWFIMEFPDDLSGTVWELRDSEVSIESRAEGFWDWRGLIDALGSMSDDVPFRQGVSITFIKRKRKFCCFIQYVLAAFALLELAWLPLTLTPTSCTPMWFLSAGLPSLPDSSPDSSSFSLWATDWAVLTMFFSSSGYGVG